MAITLVTGLPGHGKTLYSLVRWKGEAERDQREVFHNGIKGLKLDWREHEPLEWFKLPAGALMVIDEAQRVFRSRVRGSEPPPHYAQLETHRHLGLDLVLITQHPTLIDAGVRKLVDRHFHVVRSFGTQQATIYEFPTGVQDYPEKSKRKDGVIKHVWWYPKKAFDWYESAERHTVKRRIPAKVWIFLALLLALPFLFWLVYQRLWVQHGVGGSAAAAAKVASAAGPGSAAPGKLRPQEVDALSTAVYLDSMRPRIEGLAFTAPVYDRLTRPVEAPYPSVCAYSADFPCRCWSQRGFSLPVPRRLCEQLAREPMDPYWLRRGPFGFERGRGGVDDERAASAPVSGQVVALPGQAGF